MRQFQSIIILLQIQIERGIDHIHRWIYGFPTVKYSMITPFLFLGGQYGMKGFSVMKSMGITGIVNMRMHSIHQIGSITDFQIINLPTPDRKAPTLVDLKKGCDFIHKIVQKKGKVYIHCRWGEGRGASMAIAYLLSTGLTYEDSFDLVKKVRRFISPTEVQVARLKNFEIYLKDNNIEAN